MVGCPRVVAGDAAQIASNCMSDAVISIDLNFLPDFSDILGLCNMLVRKLKLENGAA
jgi:hypothetical protein